MTVQRIPEFTKNLLRFRWDFKNPRGLTQKEGVMRQGI